MKNKLLALQALQTNCLAVEAYDGWSKDDMLTNFIKKNHYNPILMATKLENKLVRKVCSKPLLKRINAYKQDPIFDSTELTALGELLTATKFHSDDVTNALIKKMLVKYTTA